ncbi:uncharacterized protein [Coffea arabica]|uniref:Retrotransposon gag domain-containing protein n=1 Tax=Coffea arabica TaxID=13443 RepID=A0ABM4VY75_COFAR
MPPDSQPFYQTTVEPVVSEHTVQTKPEMGESSAPVDMKLLKRLDRFDEFIRKSQVLSKQGVLDYDDLCLFSNVQLPVGFKTPKFNKYDGTDNPKTHLRLFVNKLGRPGDDENLPLRLFPESLEGDALDWYSTLKSEEIKTWLDLSNAFIRQYAYNCDLAPTRTTLEGTKRKPSEDHKTYAKRWRKIASQLDALQGQGNSGKNPQLKKKEGEAVSIWDQNLIPRPRPRQYPTYSNPYRYYSNPHPVDHTNITHPRPRPNYTNSPITHFQISQPNFQQVRPRPPYNQQFSPPNRLVYNYSQPPKANNPGRNRTFTNLDRPLDQLYDQLKVAGKIGIIPPPTYPYGIPVGYNPQAVCAYHSGAPGYLTAECKALKYKIQDMIEVGEIVIRRKEAQAPNVNKNPLPEYDNTIGVITDGIKEPVRNSSSEVEVFGNDAEFSDIPEGSISN